MKGFLYPLLARRSPKPMMRDFLLISSSDYNALVYTLGINFASERLRSLYDGIEYLMAMAG